MDKYLNGILEIARSIGAVNNIEMNEAGAYLPARIEINGITPSGDKFELYLRVGEPNRGNS